jgi:CheY-like chemotaxis protein
MSLPLADTAAPAAADGDTAARTATILLIDDGEDNRTLLRQVFEHVGYRVLDAPDGAKGLKVAQREPPDCVLLDLEMPGMTGFEVLDKLRQDPRTHDIPVIILTGADDNVQFLERALRAGAVDYLTKPISPVRVAVRVRGVIDRRRLGVQHGELRAAVAAHVRALSRTVVGIAADLDAIRSSEAALREPQQEAATGIDAACSTAFASLSEMLERFSEAPGETPREQPPVRAADIVEAVVNQVGRAALTKAIKFEDTYRPDWLARNRLSFDASSVEPALGWIAVNAIRRSTAGAHIKFELILENTQLEVGVTYAGDPPTAAELIVCERLLAETGGSVQTLADDAGARVVLSVPVHGQVARG